MLRRDLGNMEDRILDAWPVVAFRCAIEAFSSKQLDRSWLRSIPRHGAAILGRHGSGCFVRPPTSPPRSPSCNIPGIS
jgi:hypothetical protein